MSLGPWQVLLIAVVVLVLFGRGITSFKKGISEGTKEMEDEAADVAETIKDVTPESDKEDKV
jgi:sec-independent protein translocase protein TatA